MIFVMFAKNRKSVHFNPILYHFSNAVKTNFGIRHQNTYRYSLGKQNFYFCGPVATLKFKKPFPFLEKMNEIPLNFQ